MPCHHCLADSIRTSRHKGLPSFNGAALWHGSVPAKRSWQTRRHIVRDKRCSAATGVGPAAAPSKGFGDPSSKRAAAGKGKQQKRRGRQEEPQPVWVTDSKACPCASGRPYADCCEQYHSGSALEPTAESLMRARFSAYVKGQIDYIVQTTHPDNPAAAGTTTSNGTHTSLHEDAHATWRMTAWQSLKILKREDGESDDEAFVSFRVTFKFKNQQGERQQGTRLQTLEERSRFVQNADGRWLYQSGEVIQDWHSVYDRV